MSETTHILINWASGRAVIHEDDRNVSLDLHALRVWLDARVINRAKDQPLTPRLYEQNET